MDWSSDGSIHGSSTTINSIFVGFALKDGSYFRSGNFSSMSKSRGKVFITYYED
jgi:hypothetical protein